MLNIKKHKEEILDKELQKHVEKKTLLELQIKLNEQLDPQEKSAKKPLAFNSQGQPTSYQNITRREYIEILKKELEQINLIIETIVKSF